MKKVYETPEAKLISFISNERLAYTIDMDTLISLNGKGDATEPSDGDIDIDLKH